MPRSRRYLDALAPEDRLIITADHGVDPTTVSTDHSREYVPLLLYPRPQNAEDAVYEGGFADTGATVFSHLTGGVPTLAGDVVGELRPERGWRRYTATTAAPEPGGGGWPARVGPDEVAEAARWLREHCGGAPEDDRGPRFGSDRLDQGWSGDRPGDRSHAAAPGMSPAGRNQLWMDIPVSSRSFASKVVILSSCSRVASTATRAST